MISSPSDPAEALAAAVQEYQQQNDVGALLDRVQAIARTTEATRLLEISAPYRELPEVVIPVYERVVAARPSDAQAMVVLANAYWLTGRGADVVGELASRAIAADATNRGGWHLWALSESDQRQRVARWQQVVARFPSDDLARAALADNATSLAGAEHDYDALDLAIVTYEELLKTAQNPSQINAINTALTALRGWKL